MRFASKVVGEQIAIIPRYILGLFLFLVFCNGKYLVPKSRFSTFWNVAGTRRVPLAQFCIDADSIFAGQILSKWLAQFQVKKLAILCVCKESG
jgi:hypothetical protein